MAASRGLNKNRGLSALIPQRSGGKAGNAAKGSAAKEHSAASKEASAPAKAVKQAKKSAEKKKDKAAAPSAATGKAAEGVMTVKLSNVRPSSRQPRRRFDEDGINELAESIREHGIVTPLLVRKIGDKFELIAGERRWRAAKLAGLSEVPVLLKEFSDQETQEIALIDNLQRENLNAIEEAQAYYSLIDEFGLKQEEVARRVAKSRSAVTNALRLLKLDKSVQEMVADGRLAMGHARALLSLEDPEKQRSAAEQTVAAGLSVRDTERLVKRLTAAPRRRRASLDPQIAAIYADLEDQLLKAVGTRISIKPMRGKKGTVEIEYYSDDDLERILDLLKGGQ